MLGSGAAVSLYPSLELQVRVRLCVRRLSVEKPDDRHRWLLPMRQDRPRRSTSEPRDELAPSHPISSPEAGNRLAHLGNGQRAEKKWPRRAFGAVGAVCGHIARPLCPTTSDPNPPVLPAG
jgi:hypothetical protein